MTREERERRWNQYVSPGLQLWTRHDALLMALLRVWVHNPELSMKWVCTEYLTKQWESVVDIYGQMDQPTDPLKALWPAWKETKGSIQRDEHTEAEYSCELLAKAAYLYRGVMIQFRLWHELQPLPPIRISIAQARAAGIKLPG